MKKSTSSNYFIDKIKQNPALKGEIEDAQLSIDISMQLHTLRNEAGFTQAELAALTKISQPNIARLESPGYQGYTLKVLSKVVRALGARLRIEIIRNTNTATVAAARHDFLAASRNMSSLTWSSGTRLTSGVTATEPHMMEGKIYA